MPLCLRQKQSPLPIACFKPSHSPGQEVSGRQLSHILKRSGRSLRLAARGRQRVQLAAGPRPRALARPHGLCHAGLRFAAHGHARRRGREGTSEQARQRARERAAAQQYVGWLGLPCTLGGHAQQKRREPSQGEERWIWRGRE